MSQRPELAALLQKARESGELVRVWRKRGWNDLRGSVQALNRKWLLVATEQDAGLNGHACIRISDIRKVEPLPNSNFIQKSLNADGHWPLPRLQNIDLRTTQSILGSLADTSPLVTVFYENDYADECLIGVPYAFQRHEFRLRNLTPDARWDDKDQDAVFRYRAITKLEVGGVYERRLAAVAGDPPNH